MGSLNCLYKLFKYETIAMASPENVSHHLDNLEKVSTPAIILSNRYQVLSVLGDGGFGKTFLVEDIQMPSNRRCVLKQLKPIHDETPELRQMVQDRFQREAATLETLGEAHDQIPRLYAYFSEADQFYLVEEWVEGITVTQKVQQAGPQNEATVQTMIANLLPAITYIHSRGIVHRDIKPDNIILRSRDGKPVLIDFGAVKETMNTVINSQAHSTHSIVVGTPGYMPAEQLSGRPVYASDLYGLGMSAIYMLTGKLPQEIAIDSQTGQLCWREHAPATSTGFGNFLDCATHISIQSRFANAQDMQSILNTLMMSQMTSPPVLETQSLPSNGASVSSQSPPSAQTVISASPIPAAAYSSTNTTVVSPAMPFTTASQTPTSSVHQPNLAQPSQWKSALIIGSIVGVSILLGAVVLIEGLPRVLAGGADTATETPSPDTTQPPISEPTAEPTATETPTLEPIAAEPDSPAAPPLAAAPNANGTVSGQSGSKNIRAGSGTNYSIVGSVAVGSRIQIVDRSSDSGGFPWYKVITPVGSSGWIAGQLIQIDGDVAPPSPTQSNPPTQAPSTQAVASSRTNATIVSKESGSKNIRSGPGTNYSVSHTAYPGDRVLIRATTQDSGGYTWHKIYFPNSGAEGWIADQLLKID